MPNKNSKSISSPANRLKITSLFSLLAVLIFTLLLGRFIFNFLQETKFFTISYIEIVNRPLLGNVSSKYFYDLVGPNADIFKINLGQIEKKVEADFPQLEKIVIAKSFPNRLIFNLVGRNITAQISLGKKAYFDIASNGFILPQSHSDLNPNIPLISGFNKDYRLIMPNRQTNSPRLLYALYFIKQYKTSNWLGEERLAAIDVSSDDGFSIFLEGDLEIKILKSEINPKMKLLAGLLKEIRANSPQDLPDGSQVKCIDLRFKDVIINPSYDKNRKK